MRRKPINLGTGKSQQGTFSDWSKTSLFKILLCAHIKESCDYSLNELTDHQKVNASDIFEIVLGTLRMLMLLQASILYGWASQVNLIPGI